MMWMVAVVRVLVPLCVYVWLRGIVSEPVGGDEYAGHLKCELYLEAGFDML
jgi:hypothetical protein